VLAIFYIVITPLSGRTLSNIVQGPSSQP
jgi:hypothetical protein